MVASKVIPIVVLLAAFAGGVWAATISANRYARRKIEEGEWDEDGPIAPTEVPSRYKIGYFGGTAFISLLPSGKIPEDEEKVPDEEQQVPGEQGAVAPTDTREPGP